MGKGPEQTFFPPKDLQVANRYTKEMAYLVAQW